MEDIHLPMTRGSMDDIDLGESSTSQTYSQDDEKMEVDDTSSSQVRSAILTSLSLIVVWMILIWKNHPLLKHIARMMRRWRWMISRAVRYDLPYYHPLV